MGHSNYGESAWPNELLYIFPVVMLEKLSLFVRLAVLDSAMIGEPANPFATPLDFFTRIVFISGFSNSSDCS